MVAISVLWLLVPSPVAILFSVAVGATAGGNIFLWLLLTPVFGVNILGLIIMP